MVTTVADIMTCDVHTQIVLRAFQKHNNEEVGELVRLNPQQVSVWRNR